MGNSPSYIPLAVGDTAIGFGLIRYLYNGGVTTDEGRSKWPVSKCKIVSMSVISSGNDCNGDTFITLRRNETDTNMVAIIPASLNTAVDVFGVVFYNDGDFYSVKVDTTPSTAGDLFVTVSLRSAR